MIPTVKNTAIAVIAANRPKYLQKVLYSIAKNTVKLPVHLFVDLTASGKIIQAATTKLAKHILGDQLVEVIERDKPYGCGKNITQAQFELFDKPDYEYGFIFEDDSIVTPQYLNLCMNAMKWAEERYDNIAIVQGWSLSRLSDELRMALSGRIEITHHNLWAYLMSKTAWNRVRPFRQAYYSYIANVNYRNRPNTKIRSWFNQITSASKQPIGERQLSPQDWARHLAIVNPAQAITGQDAAFDVCLAAAGLMRLGFTVSRAKNIGEKGIHMTPHKYRARGFSQTVLDAYPEDDTRQEFTLHL